MGGPDGRLLRIVRDHALRHDGLHLCHERPDFVTTRRDPLTTLRVRVLSGLPVEDVIMGDIVTLPKGRQVRVEHVDAYDDGTFVVRWKAGRELGSLYPMRAGETVNVTVKGRR